MTFIPSYRHITSISDQNNSIPPPPPWHIISDIKQMLVICATNFISFSANHSSIFICLSLCLVVICDFYLFVVVSFEQSHDSQPVQWHSEDAKGLRDQPWPPLFGSGQGPRGPSLAPHIPSSFYCQRLEVKTPKCPQTLGKTWNRKWKHLVVTVRTSSARRLVQDFSQSEMQILEA